ncbi:hypothetical protein B0T24DRAFT_700659 [Lasiosphaeria ovina]|uniref:DUF8040 domain-containing protein n=1 Tax=Lasiosphaeria ovina TaxID=92902 RepID=A0AAE0KHS4_9PEZI|nr:hypothetical protein B0T24DRAFT_700659 [Lasiosphaeria ovina]
MPRNALAKRSRYEVQRRKRMRLCILLLLALAVPRDPYKPVNLNAFKGMLTTNELLFGHVGRLFSLIRMRVATFFALVAWLKHNTELRASRHLTLEEKVLIFLVMVSYTFLPRRDRRNKKGGLMTNEGSANDGRMFASALTRGLVIPNGFNYLADLAKELFKYGDFDNEDLAE